MVGTVVLDLVERIAAVAVGTTVEVPLAPGDTERVAAWCARTGNHLVEIAPGRAVVRRGPSATPTEAELPPDRHPGARLWIYTNFDCNLACDYCCARSSPKRLAGRSASTASGGSPPMPATPAYARSSLPAANRSCCPTWISS